MPGLSSLSHESSSFPEGSGSGANGGISGGAGLSTGGRGVAKRVWRGDDLLYLWTFSDETDNVMRINNDIIVSQNVTRWWAHFAKMG